MKEGCLDLLNKQLGWQSSCPLDPSPRPGRAYPYPSPPTAPKLPKKNDAAYALGAKTLKPEIRRRHVMRGKENKSS